MVKTAFSKPKLSYNKPNQFIFNMIYAKINYINSFGGLKNGKR